MDTVEFDQIVHKKANMYMYVRVIQTNDGIKKEREV